MYETVTYTGGVHRSDEFKELIEDLGGFIIQENTMQMDFVITLAVPVEDLDKVKEKAESIQGEITTAPMAGTEIAVVSPTLARQHLPHSACDIAEFLRRYGTKDNMVGLARGAGKGICSVTRKELDLIEEHDLAIYAMGSFESCLKDKTHLFADLNIPVIVTGSPLEMDLEELNGADAYIGDLGRIPRRLKRGENIIALENLAKTTEKLLEEKKKELSTDPPIVPPILLKSEIEKQVEEIEFIHSPTPITTQLDGLRIKLNYDDYHEVIENVKVSDYILKDIAEIKKSKMYDYILVKINTVSSLD